MFLGNPNQGAVYKRSPNFSWYAWIQAVYFVHIEIKCYWLT
jgi:hypothetical protein